MRIEPAVGSRTPRTMLMVVVFPAPFGPSSPTISTRITSNEISATAIISPYFFERFSTESALGMERVSHDLQQRFRLFLLAVQFTLRSHVGIDPFQDDVGDIEVVRT